MLSFPLLLSTALLVLLAIGGVVAKTDEKYEEAVKWFYPPSIRPSKPVNIYFYFSNPADDDVIQQHPTSVRFTVKRSWFLPDRFLHEQPERDFAVKDVKMGEYRISEFGQLSSRQDLFSILTQLPEEDREFVDLTSSDLLSFTAGRRILYQLRVSVPNTIEFLWKKQFRISLKQASAVSAFKKLVAVSPKMTLAKFTGITGWFKNVKSMFKSHKQEFKKHEGCFKECKKTYRDVNRVYTDKHMPVTEKATKFARIASEAYARNFSTKRSGAGNLIKYHTAPGGIDASDFEGPEKGGPGGSGGVQKSHRIVIEELDDDDEIDENVPTVSSAPNRFNRNQNIPPSRIDEPQDDFEENHAEVRPAAGRARPSVRPPRLSQYDPYA